MTDYTRDKPLHSFPALWFDVLRKGEGAIPFRFQDVDGETFEGRWTPGTTVRRWGHFLSCIRKSNHELQPRAISRIWYTEIGESHILVSSRPATKVEQERLRKTCQKPGREG